MKSVGICGAEARCHTDWRRPFEDPGLRTAVEVPMFGSVSATRQN